MSSWTLLKAARFVCAGQKGTPDEHNFLGLAELLTLPPGDPRWGYSLRSLDLYQRRMPPAARSSNRFSPGSLTAISPPRKRPLRDRVGQGPL